MFNCLSTKQTIEIIQLANCCAGEAEPAGETEMERRWRRSDIKQAKVMTWCEDYMTLLAKLISQLWLCDVLTDPWFIL